MSKKRIVAVVVIGICIAGIIIIPVLYARLSSHGFLITDIRLSESVYYFISVFMAGNSGNYILGAIAVLMVIFSLGYNKKTLVSEMSKMCSVYLILNCIAYAWIGKSLHGARYFITSHIVYMMLIANIIILSAEVVYNKLWKKLNLAKLGSYALCGIALISILNGCLTYYPGWSLSTAKRSDLKKVTECMEKSSVDTKVVIVSGNSGILNYVGDIGTFVSFKSESKVKSYEIIDNIFMSEGGIPLIGSWNSWNAYFSTLSDEDIVCFIGIKTSACDSDMIGFLSSVGTFSEAVCHTKKEWIDLVDSYYAEKNKIIW